MVYCKILKDNLENYVCLFLHLTGKHFELESNPIQAEFTQSMEAVQLGGVQIEYLSQREGNKSFVMEITNVTLLEKREQNLSLDPGFNNYLFIHKILNQAEVVIVNIDGMLCVCTCPENTCMSVCT